MSSHQGPHHGPDAGLDEARRGHVRRQSGGGPDAGAEAASEKKDDVIDADFQEVDEKDQKKRA